jgi:hypothetical protein
MHVDSLQTLELVVLLQTGPPACPIRVLCEHLRIPPERAAVSLDRLARAGLVTLSEELAIWTPAACGSGDAAERLAAEYGLRRLDVIAEINAQHRQLRVVRGLGDAGAPVSMWRR